MTTENLDALLQGVWAGDVQAAARLLSQHGAEISRLVRLYLTDPHPCRVGDGPTPGHSALATCLDRVAAGRLDLCSAEQLRLLLAVLSRRMAVRAARPSKVAPPALLAPVSDKV